MPTKTIYIKDSDLQLFEQFQQKFGGSLSSLFVDCIREKLAEREEAEHQVPLVRSMVKITVVLWNENGCPALRKTFTGGWLVRDMPAAGDQEDAHFDAGGQYSVAQTAKGAIAVYWKHCDGMHAPWFKVFGSWAEFSASDELPQNVHAEAASALDVPCEIILDI